MEHESIVGKFHGRQFRCVDHELVWINAMTHRRGHTSMGDRGRPYSEAGGYQGGRGNGKQTDLAHLGSPRLRNQLIVAPQHRIVAMHDQPIAPLSKVTARRFTISPPRNPIKLRRKLFCYLLPFDLFLRVEGDWASTTHARRRTRAHRAAPQPDCGHGTCESSPYSAARR